MMMSISFTPEYRKLDVHLASECDVAEAIRMQADALASEDLDIYVIPAALRGSVAPLSPPMPCVLQP
jgi:hypothetical protein